MSGHSKWSQIKRAKGAADAARGKLFTKIGKEIVVAVKAGGSDPNGNAKLREIIAKAKAANMPNDNIQRSIKKASDPSGGANYERLVYEGYGPAGVAVIVETLTDNKNRTAGEVRSAFEKHGGSLGVSGSVAFAFDKADGEWVPAFTVPVPEDKEKAFEKMLDLLDECDDVQDVWHNAE